MGRDRGGCKKGQEKGEIKEEFERNREREFIKGEERLR